VFHRGKLIIIVLPFRVQGLTRCCGGVWGGVRVNPNLSSSSFRLGLRGLPAAVVVYGGVFGVS